MGALPPDGEAVISWKTTTMAAVRVARICSTGMGAAKEWSRSVVGEEGIL